MKIGSSHILVCLAVVLFIGFLIGKINTNIEKFEDLNTCNICNKPKPCGCKKEPSCSKCSNPKPCGCDKEASCSKCNRSKPCGCQTPLDSPLPFFGSAEVPQQPTVKCPRPLPCKPCEEKECSACPTPDPSKWVLKSSVPPCPAMPDMSRYMLKTECPSIPDMSKYTLKSSIPSCPPCIATCSKPCKIGECPPCPRPRCPVVQCPEPKSCPACPAASCAPCSEPDIKCKASYEPSRGPRPMLASTSTFGF